MKKPLKIALLKSHIFDNDYPYSVQGIARLKKLGYDPTKKEFCGCFTPMEIISLLKLGVEPVPSNVYLVDYIKEKKAKGECSPTWFYFYPNDKFLELKERAQNENH